MSQKREKSEAAQCHGVEILVIVVDELLRLCQITRLSRNCQCVPVLAVFCSHVPICSAWAAPAASPGPRLPVREWPLGGTGRRPRAEQE